MKHLFLEGCPLKNKGFDLSQVLDAHEKCILDKVKSISDIEQLTDNFLSKLVDDSLVKPVFLKTNQKTRKTKTEYFNAFQLPCNIGMSSHYSNEKYPKTVATICIPFEGDPKLLQHCPNSYHLNFPFGQVVGKTIQFDVVFWGESDCKSEEKAIQFIEDNLKNIEYFLEKSNKNVKEFNSNLPNKVISIFKQKSERLNKENKALDAIGITEQNVEYQDDSIKKSKNRNSKIVVQVVQNMYVQHLNQINNNTGDVNNEIQSDKQ